MKKNGMVAFFDILGYQNLIMNNDIEKAADIATNLFQELPPEVSRQTKELFTHHREYLDQSKTELIDDIIRSFDYVILSDSILIFLPTDEIKYKSWVPIYWSIFLLFCCLLLEKSFRAGLPLRGAIEFGEYIRRDNCIVGKTVIDGYLLSNQLEFSGCAICAEAYTEIKSIIKNDLIRFFVFEYLAPLKNSEKQMILLNWVTLPAYNQDLLDVRQFVLKQFHSHNKDIPANAIKKLDNTERIIRYSLILNQQKITQSN